MDLITPALLIKVIGGLFATIGILIGVIWYFIRNEIKEIKDSLEKMRTSFAKVPIDFMSKEDCKRIHNAKNN